MDNRKIADDLEAEYLAVANGVKKPAKIAMEPMVRAVEALRATPTPLADAAAIAERTDAPLSLIPHLVARDEKAVSAALLEMGDAIGVWRTEAAKYREVTSHDQSAFCDGYEAGMAAILSARAALATTEAPMKEISE